MNSSSSSRLRAAAAALFVAARPVDGRRGAGPGNASSRGRKAAASGTGPHQDRSLSRGLGEGARGGTGRRPQRQRDLPDRADADRCGFWRGGRGHRSEVVRSAQRVRPRRRPGQAAHDRVDRQHVLPFAAVRQVDAMEPALSARGRHQFGDSHHADPEPVPERRFRRRGEGTHGRGPGRRAGRQPPAGGST